MARSCARTETAVGTTIVCSSHLTMCLRVIILPLGGALSTWLSRPQRCGLDNHVDNAPPSGKIITRRHIVKWLLQTIVVPTAVSVLAQLLAIYVGHWIR